MASLATTPPLASETPSRRFTRSCCRDAPFMPWRGTTTTGKASWPTSPRRSPTRSGLSSGDSPRCGTKSSATSRPAARSAPSTSSYWTRSSSVAMASKTRILSTRSSAFSATPTWTPVVARASTVGKLQRRLSGLGSRSRWPQAAQTTCGSQGTTPSGVPAATAPSNASSTGSDRCSSAMARTTSVATTTCWSTSCTRASTLLSSAPARSAATPP
mmetsp:Transcript_49677/g.126557  ORF Transcript_49677/g.126557 Transcript_49677/m.126557 type:complete len:215 (-) Transcript_49677:298-942(-)